MERWTWWLFRSRQRMFRLNFFMAGIASLSFLAWFLNTVAPEEGSVIVVGIVLICITLGSFLFSFSKNVRRILLITGGLGVFLGLRAIGLHDILYLFLLCIVLISLEYALRKR